MNHLNQSGIEGVETDFGFVAYSAKTLHYLDTHAPGRNQKQRKSKRRDLEAYITRRVEEAASTCAKIAFVSGELLEAF